MCHDVLAAVMVELRRTVKPQTKIQSKIIIAQLFGNRVKTYNS